MKKSESKSKKYYQTIARYLIELIIVFAGVYGAFLLSEYKENRREAKRKNQIYDALLKEIKFISQVTHKSAKDALYLKQLYDKKIADGEMPILEPLIYPLIFTPHMWNATIQSDGINLLEVRMIEDLSGFYNRTQILVEQFCQLRELCESFVLPSLDKDKSEFYDYKTKQLKPKYEWYLKGLEQVGKECSTVGMAADSLIVFLSQRKKAIIE